MHILEYISKFFNREHIRSAQIFAQIKTEIKRWINSKKLKTRDVDFVK